MLTFLRCDKRGRPLVPKPRPRLAERPLSDELKARNDALLRRLGLGWTEADLVRESGLAPSTVRAGLAEARRRREAEASAREACRQAEARMARERDHRWHHAAMVVNRGDACWLRSPPA
jgi:hypothetical protein